MEARYFDGVTSRAETVQLEALGGWLHIRGAQTRRDLPARDLDIAAGKGAAPTRINLAGGGHCELANGPDAEALLAALRLRRPWSERLEAHRGAIVASLVAFIVLAVVAWRWGLPWVTDRIVDRMPVAWDQRLGESALRELEERGFLQDSRLPAQRQQAIRDEFSRLVLPPGTPAVTLRFVRLQVPNAFALPGGTILLSDELVDLAQDQPGAITTVLAHELGHVKFRHGMRALVHAGLASALAAWYAGDFSSLAASAGAGMAGLHYSRAAEDAADHFALDLMHANGRSTQGAAVLFRRLAEGKAPAKETDGKSKEPGAQSAHLQLPAYLSTHPDIQERIALFEDGGGAFSPR